MKIWYWNIEYAENWRVFTNAGVEVKKDNEKSSTAKKNVEVWTLGVLVGHLHL